MDNLNGNSSKNDPQESENLEEGFFAPGVDPDDISSLWSLRQKGSLLDALSALFRGADIYIHLRLLVLSEMVSKLDHPAWAMGELRHAFGYLSERAFDWVFKGLRESGLIAYDRETNSYYVTPLGQKAHSSISFFLKSEEDDGIGMLTGMVYAGEISDTLGSEELGHLLYRLNQLEYEIAYAIESSSEHQILQARERYEAIWKYLEKGTDIIKKLTKDRELDRTTHRIAQQIGHAQSKLAKFTSVFQRVLNEIDKQRVHLGNSGVSTSDIDRYLMRLTADELTALFEESLGICAEPCFLLTDVMADIAEYEIVEKERQKPEDWTLPKPVASPVAEEELLCDFALLDQLGLDVSSVESDMELKTFVPKNNYEESAYRLSMLALIGNNKEFGSGHMADFVILPYDVIFDSGIEEVLKDGVKEISRGRISRMQHDSQ